MGYRDYPKLGTTKLLNRPNQYGRTHPPANQPLCFCCECPATHRIDVQNDWMRGNDDVFLLCRAHLEMARAGKWAALYKLARAIGRLIET